MCRVSQANRLSDWLRAFVPARPDALTHLKLQKLAFYAHGAMLAFDMDRETGPLEFQAWKHGPVAPSIHARFKGCGAEPVGRPLPWEDTPRFSLPTEDILSCIVNVYGRMTAWQLREESHAEAPWREAFDGTPSVVMRTERLRSHFKAKFVCGVVHFPERLFGTSSMALDRIPVPTFETLVDMSRVTTRILGQH